MTASRLVARNFLALGSGEMISRMMAFGMAVYLARILGAEGYGVIALAMGVTLYLSKIAEFSIEVIGTKELAKAPDSVNHLASAVMSVRLVLAVFLAAVAILVTRLVVKEPERTIMSLYFLSVIPIAGNAKWIHLGLENARPVGFSRIVGEALCLGLVLGLVQNKADLWGAPVARIAGEICFAVLLVLMLRRRNCRFGLRWDLSTALPVFLEALPVLGHTLLWLIIYNSDLIFLRFFRDGESVGYYAAAYMLISFLANVGFSYGMSLLPTLTRLGARTAEERSLYQTALAHVYVVCLPISIAGCILASQLITFGFGDGYIRSVPALRVLIWCIPLLLLRTVPWVALLARGKQNLIFKAVLYSVIANLTLNLLLIPRHGILGAAVATIVTESLTGILFFAYIARQDLLLPSLQRFWRPTVASLCMMAVLLLLRSSHLVAGLAAGTGSYVAVLTILGGIRLHRGIRPALSL